MVEHAAERQAFLYARNSTILALACLISVGCASTAPPYFFSRSPSDRPIQEDDIRESVLRYRLNPSKSNGPFFLSINGHDPSDAFMRRFADSGRIVKKASESYFKKDPFPGWLRDRSTDEKGMSLWVGPINWLSSDRVEVRGGMYCGGLCADAGIYRLKKKEGHWVVVEYKVQMIS